MINKILDLFTNKKIKENNTRQESYKKDHSNTKHKLSYQEKIQKGKKYEVQVVQYLEMNGYLIEHRSKNKGRKDKGIDILAKKEELYYLIQCKNYAPTTRIKHNIIKEFNSNCLDFINANSNKLSRGNTKFILAINTRESLQSCAINYLKDTNNKCEFIEIAYKDTNN